MKPYLQKPPRKKNDHDKSSLFHQVPAGILKRVPILSKLYPQTLKFTQAPKLLWPPFWFFLCLIFGITTQIYVPIQVYTPFLFGVGSLLLATGIGFMFASIWAFYSNKNDIRPFYKTNVLMENGVYAISRNPTYLALAFLLAGALFLYQPPWGLWVLGPYFYKVRQFILQEELQLQLEFEEKYTYYCSRVSRWL